MANTRLRLKSLFWAILFVIAGLSAARAEVTRVEISDRQPYADGREFGEHGSYERLRGKAFFAIDPRDAANQAIVDLELAPRDAQGRVEFSADLEILAPTDLARASGGLLYDVNNRGNRVCLSQFNGGADEFLMRQGLIVVWSGWIAEVLPGGDRLRLNAPEARENGQPVRGVVRAEMVPDAHAERLSIAHWANQGSYMPTERGLAEATLTWRVREKDPRVPIPRDQWRLETTWVEANGQKGQLPLVEMVLAGGFEPGYIYELVYDAQGSLVQGCGLAGIRDLVSCLKYAADERNPLRKADGAPAVQFAYGFGTSQSGRCLRVFLHEGFNIDEQKRMVFDGLIPHVTGGGLGFFNHRFASPTRHNGQHDNHLYPTDVFPFAYGESSDPLGAGHDGILRKSRLAEMRPKVMHTQSSSEYWHRAGSLVHTDTQGQDDAQIPENVRIYAFGGTQHGPGSGIAGDRANGQLPANPNDYRPFLRALFVALDSWVRNGTEPPDSVYPRLSNGTLVGWRQEESGWHPLPGVRYPEVIQQPEAVDRGPFYAAQRRSTIEPPLWRASYVVKVPAYGPGNNELGTLLLPSVAVPVATYTSWNLRHRSIGAENELLGLSGGYVAFRRTAQERMAAGDPRPALLERYRDFEDYQRQFMAEAQRLLDQRYLLPEDMPRLAELAEQHRKLFE